MAELLLELFSEEIPARMQPRAEADLKRLLEAALSENSLEFQEVKTYSTPRRLTAHIIGLPSKTADVKEQRKGPKVDAPEQAIAGFSKSVGLAPGQLSKRDGYLFATIEKKGRATSDVLAEAIPGIITKFPWPKSMRWGAGKLRWVRPLHSILCILDGKVAPFEVDGIASGNTTVGHRFLSPGWFEVKDFADYKHKLNKAHVILDAVDRKHVILAFAEKLAKKHGLDLIPDDALVQEIAGLVEWPVVLVGGFDRAFLEVPEEALISEMRHHQKYFALRKGGKLAPHFIFVSNTPGQGDAIIKGNERVLGARLSDAKFFWDQDRKVKLEDLKNAAFKTIFFEGLGTYSDKILRVLWIIDRLATDIPGLDIKKAHKAAEFCKADLASGMVGEFPDLQGKMGYYYALENKFDHNVALAIRDHYSPQGPSDTCPDIKINPETVVLALADKLDTLIAFIAKAQQVPTGSKDPYALRRAALGIIRLIVENNLRINLLELISKTINNFNFSQDQILIDPQTNVAFVIFNFFVDRLKVQQREKGIRHDLIDAVFSLGHEDDLVRILARVSALQKFLKTKDGENLLAGHKRALNILRIEESKDGKLYSSFIKNADTMPLNEKEELALNSSLQTARRTIDQALMEEDFVGAMTAVAKLRAPIDDFFNNVKVNVDDEIVRENRLRLLAGIRITLMDIADFSKIEG